MKSFLSIVVIAFSLTAVAEAKLANESVITVKQFIPGQSSSPWIVKKPSFRRWTCAMRAVLVWLKSWVKKNNSVIVTQAGTSAFTTALSSNTSVTMSDTDSIG